MIIYSLTGSISVVLSLWRRDRNRIDSYRVRMIDVPEFPIASGYEVLGRVDISGHWHT